MKMKKWLASVSATVLLSGFFALPQAIAGPVVISNNSSKVVNVIAYAGTAYTNIECGAYKSNTDFTYLNNGITRVIVQLQASSTSWTTMADYTVPSVAVNKAFTVIVNGDETVVVREVLPGQ
jgi:hypothetical protein